MIDVATLSVIRRWALREQLSIREIARRTGLSRNTIRKYLRAGEPPELLEQAQRAAENEGAFFTTGYEQDLVVVPSLGLLIYSYNG